MLIIDTNVLAYLLIHGDHTAAAQRLHSRDPDWRSEAFLLVEFTNVLASSIATKRITFASAQNLLAKTIALFDGKLARIPHSLVLAMAARHDISAYDAFSSSGRSARTAPCDRGRSSARGGTGAHAVPGRRARNQLGVCLHWHHESAKLFRRAEAAQRLQGRGRLRGGRVAHDSGGFDFSSRIQCAAMGDANCHLSFLLLGFRSRWCFPGRSRSRPKELCANRRSADNRSHIIPAAKIVALTIVLAVIAAGLLIFQFDSPGIEISPHLAGGDDLEQIDRGFAVRQS